MQLKQSTKSKKETKSTPYEILFGLTAIFWFISVLASNNIIGNISKENVLNIPYILGWLFGAFNIQLKEYPIQMALQFVFIFAFLYFIYWFFYIYKLPKENEKFK